MNYPELRGKRLLVLGGNSWKNAIKKFAEENGIIIVCAGNNPNANLNEIADEYYNVNSIDHNLMKKLIVDKKIDGIYLGGNEIVISHACVYVNEMGLPCYCKKEQWDSLQNKEMFKKHCIAVDLPVVPQIFYNPENICLPENAFPVITKPVDGCGSNGFSICYNNDELKQGYLRASQSSESGKVLIERYVKNKGNVVYYTVTNGKIIFSSLSEKYPVKFEKYGTFVGGLFVYESSYVDEFRKKFEDKIQLLIKNMGITEGTFWIEVFHDGDEYYFNEAGYRYGGSASIYPIDYLHNINQVASDIYYALTGESKVFGHTSLFPKDVLRKKFYAVYPVYVRAGKISKYIFNNEIINNKKVLLLLPTKEVGNIVEDTGSFAQVALLVHFVYDTYEEMNTLIRCIHKNISIFDENGDDMIICMLNKEKNR